MAAAEENYYRWLRVRTTTEVIRQAARFVAAEEERAVAAPPSTPPPTPPDSGTLAAAAHPGDSHIWVTELLPLTCEQVTISGLNSETHHADSEKHRLDLSMARAHDGPARHAVWLETTLRRTWQVGARVTAC
jgi:hypothetical protein